MNNTIPQKNRMLLFFAVTSLFWFALYAYVPFFVPYAEEMQADVRLIGLITGAYGFVQMFIRFPLGIISDRIGKRKVFIMAGLILAASSGLVVVFFPTPIALLVARSLAGAAASTWVIITVLGSSYTTPDKTVKTIGALNACNAFGRVFALLLGGIAAQLLGVPYAFVLAGVAGIAGFALSTFVVEKKPETREPQKLSDLLAVIKNRQLLCAATLAILSQYITFSTTFGFLPSIASGLGASNFALGVLGMAAALPGIIIAPYVAKLLGKFGAGGILVTAFLISAAACVSIPFAREIWQLFVIQIINNIGLIAVMTSLMGLCIKDIPTSRRATAMGFFQASYGLGMFVGPFVMGWIAHQLNMTYAFIFTGAVAVLSASISLLFVKRKWLRSTIDS